MSGWLVNPKFGHMEFPGAVLNTWSCLGASRQDILCHGKYNQEIMRYAPHATEVIAYPYVCELNSFYSS
jgi:hypothetical protein